MDEYEEKISERYMTLSSALKCLQGVMPNKSKKLIEDALEIKYTPGLQEIYSRYIVGKTELTEEEYQELWIETFTYYGETIRISPAGAKTLLKLYCDGDLILKKGVEISEETTLKDYIAREREFKEKAGKLRQDGEKRKFLLSNPDKVKEGDFSYELLNELFFRHLGPARDAQTMVIDGITVTKNITLYRSNSGKSHDFAVTISWTGSDGKYQQLKKGSIYEGNRRNDAERNWGLPE